MLNNKIGKCCPFDAGELERDVTKATPITRVNSPVK